MKTMFAAYVAIDSVELLHPICVEETIQDCKQKFYDWYKTAGKKNCTVRYAVIADVELEKCGEVTKRDIK
jgi:hypothetical protein